MFKFLVLSSLLALPGLATASELQFAAHSLEQAANHLYHDAGHRHYDDVAKDAAKFAKVARHFHRQTEQHKGRKHLYKDFDKVERRYQHLVSTLRPRGHGHRDRAILSSLHDVERAMIHVRYSLRSERRQSHHQDAVSRDGYRNRDYRGARYRGGELEQLTAVLRQINHILR